MSGTFERRQIQPDDVQGDGIKIASTNGQFVPTHLPMYGPTGELIPSTIAAQSAQGGGPITINGGATVTVNGSAVSYDNVVRVNGRDPSDPGSVTSGDGPTPGAGSGGTPPPGGGTATDLASQIYGDMTGLNEAHPHGVPSGYDFYSGPVITQGNNPGSNNAILAWGDVYEDAAGNPATNTRVRIRNLRLSWMRKSNGAWTDISIPLSTSDAGAYPEDFSGGESPADVRSEGTGTISLKPAGVVDHFFGPFPRISIDRNDFGGVVVVAEAQLILDDPMGTDDRASAKYLLGTGADYYPSTNGSGIANNPGVAGGKFKYVTTTWRSFSMTTLTLAQLSANPPHITLTGISA